MSNTIVARLTVTRADGRKTIVEIHRDATFSQFYRFHTQSGNRWSTKRLVRTASRNEFLPVINTHLYQPGLDVIAKRLAGFQSQSNPVVSSKLRILRKRAYRKMLSARPDKLGLTRLTHVDMTPRRSILVSVPSYRLLTKISRRKLHAGVR